MSNYEKKALEAYENDKELPDKVNISMLKYFWQAGPLSGGGVGTIPKYLRKIGMLKRFTDNELRLLSKYLHLRSFEKGEYIFKKDQRGFGLYFIFEGQIKIFGEINDKSDTPLDNSTLATLDKFDHFGELSLLEENSTRTASALSMGKSHLLGIFKPDLDQLLEVYPTVGAKLVRAVSEIVINRFTNMAMEYKRLKLRVYELESSKDDN